MGVPSFFLLKRIGSTSLAAMGMILIMLPMFLLAMYERDGLPLEKVLYHIIRAKYLRPGVRLYRTENIYAPFTGRKEAPVAKSKTPKARTPRG